MASALPLNPWNILAGRGISDSILSQIFMGWYSTPVVPKLNTMPTVPNVISYDASHDWLVCKYRTAMEKSTSQMAHTTAMTANPPTAALTREMRSVSPSNSTVAPVTEATTLMMVNAPATLGTARGSASRYCASPMSAQATPLTAPALIAPPKYSLSPSSNAMPSRAARAAPSPSLATRSLLRLAFSSLRSWWSTMACSAALVSYLIMADKDSTQAVKEDTQAATAQIPPLVTSTELDQDPHSTTCSLGTRHTLNTNAP
jgi:hypothetical protein